MSAATRLKAVHKVYVMEVDDYIVIRMGDGRWLKQSGHGYVDCFTRERRKFLEEELQKLLAMGAEDLCVNGGG